jgi:hypothetical protein
MIIAAAAEAARLSERMALPVFGLERRAAADKRRRVGERREGFPRSLFSTAARGAKLTRWQTFDIIDDGKLKGN